MHNLEIMSVEDRVTAVIAEQLGCATADIKPESKLVTDLGADSLDVIEMVMALEDEFEIDIPDEDWAGFKTAQDVTGYITGRLA